MQLRPTSLSRGKTVDGCARGLVSITAQTPEGRRCRQVLSFGEGGPEPGGLRPRVLNISMMALSLGHEIVTVGVGPGFVH